MIQVIIHYRFSR